MSMVTSRYLTLQNNRAAIEVEVSRMASDNKLRMVEYSNQLLELVRSIIGQVAVLKFRTFQDTHDMHKVTKTQVEALAKDVAMTANRSLNENHISFDVTFFTKEFYEEYVVDTSIILVKQMIDNFVAENQDFS